MRRRLNDNPTEANDELTQPRRRRQRGDELAHDLRNGLAGVRGAVQIVRDSLGSCPERDILGAAMARLDRIDRQLREVLLADTDADSETDDGVDSPSTRSGVRRILLPPGAIKTRS